MKTKLYLIFGVLVLFFGNATFSFAATPKRLDMGTGMCRELNFNNSGWVSEGHVIFKNNCKSCHRRGNDKGARFLEAESTTSEGWNRVFYRRNAKCAKDGSWASLTTEQILQLNDYLYWNAYGTYDANTAERCG